MNIKKAEENGKVILELDGWLDTLGAPELGAEVEKIQEASELVLDFDKVEYIASSGVRQVVVCHRKAKELNASFSIINVCSEIMNIFNMTGIDKKINICEKG